MGLTEIQTFDAQPRLSADQMISVYDNLERTNLPGDDFAEAFVTYLHTVLMKKPLVVTIYKDGAAAKTYTAC